MNIDAGKDGEEGVFRTASDLHVLKIVIIENAIVNTLSRSTVLIDLFPGTGFIEKRTGIADIGGVIDIDNSSVIRRAAVTFVITMINFA